MSVSVGRLATLVNSVESFADEVRELVALRKRIARSLLRRPHIPTRKRPRGRVRS
jgi:hypothetical protein